jgi:peptide/nickel transport system substrate-binding protein
MSQHKSMIDRIRRNLDAVDNDLIDELAAGRIDRRAFLRHGSMLGLSLPLLGSMATAFGAFADPTPAEAAGKPGANVRVALSMPAGAVDPMTIADNGGLELLIQACEFLAVLQPDLTLKPVLAESWSHNADASVWTFKLRRNVKFHSGKAFTADDVVATIDRLCNPKNASNALSAFKGILSPGNTKKIDDHTVAFHLDAPYGAFPYVVSSDNYNCVILPASYAGDFEHNWDGTGPFKLEKYTAKVNCSFVRNPHYWGRKALPARTEFTFFNDIQPQVIALQGGQVDLIAQVPVAGAQALFNDPNFVIIHENSAGHEQVHMRCDTGPFMDKRVRQALALTLNRKALVKGLFRGTAVVGNDSPFAPCYPMTDKTIPQREQDIRKAKELLAAAGVPNGFKVTLTTERYIEIPDYAVLIQSFAKEAGIDITLNIENQDAYYGKATFGQSDWLDSTLGITDYGHRGVPNVFLRAPLLSTGSWNSAHFKNPTYDNLVDQYGRAADLGSQRKLASQIQHLLLDETPVIFGYFYDYLLPTKKGVTGIPPIANRLYLQDVSIA